MPAGSNLRIENSAGPLFPIRRFDPAGIAALIPAWNAAATLAEVVEAIRAQEPAVAEILVADDGSTDGTARIAAKAGARVLDLGGRQGICAGRNALAQAAAADLLWFVDADSIPAPGCLALLLAGLDSHGDAGLVHGTNVLPPALATPAGTAYAVLGRHHFLRTTRPRYTSHATTANCLIRREVVGAAGWFQHFQLGEVIYDFYEDLDLALRARRLGWRCWFEPAAETRHENPRRGVRAFLRHRVKCGTCSTLVRRKHRDLASYPFLYPASPWAFLPLTPFLALASAAKAIAFHLAHGEIAPTRVILAAPLVLLGQLWFASGAARAAFLARDPRLLIVAPGVKPTNRK